MQWYDTHTHLNDEAYQKDWQEVVKRAEEQGVKWLNLIGYDWLSSIKAVELAKQINQYAVVGIHPHDADTWSEQIKKGLQELLQNKTSNRIVAVGEIGLDYHYDNSPRDKQREVFWQQLQLAHQFGLPVVIHSRDAQQETYEILVKAKAEKLLRSQAGVIHCYSGSSEMAKLYIELGFYIGIDGPLTFKNAKQPQTVVKEIDRNRLILETDCPYLTPVPYRGKRNEPANIPLIADKVAELWQCTSEEVAIRTTENAKELFAI